MNNALAGKGELVDDNHKAVEENGIFSQKHALIKDKIIQYAEKPLIPTKVFAKVLIFYKRYIILLKARQINCQMELHERM